MKPPLFDFRDLRPTPDEYARLLAVAKEIWERQIADMSRPEQSKLVAKIKFKAKRAAAAREPS